MQPHRLLALAVPRGAAKRIDKRLGLQTNGERCLSHMRPAASPNNHQTGRVSPIERAKRFINAVASENPEGGRLLAFDLVSGVTETNSVETPEEAVLQMACGFLEAVTGLLTPGLSADEREARVLRGGAGYFAARTFVSRTPPDEPNHGSIVLKIAA